MAATIRELNQISYDRKIASLQKLYDSLDELNSSPVEQSTFDTGTYGARQHVKMRDIEKVTRQITVLESQIDRLARVLNREGVYRMRMSRYGAGA